MTAARPPFAGAAVRSMAGAYSQVQTHTGVSSADPHTLVRMLYDGLLESLATACGAIQRGDVVAKCESLSRAARIVDEGLKAGLNLERGGEVAHTLNSLYAYISVIITKANLRSDESLVREVITLVQPLREAWVAIGDQVRPAA